VEQDVPPVHDPHRGQEPDHDSPDSDVAQNATTEPRNKINLDTDHNERGGNRFVLAMRGLETLRTLLLPIELITNLFSQLGYPPPQHPVIQPLPTLGYPHCHQAGQPFNPPSDAITQLSILLPTCYISTILHTQLYRRPFPGMPIGQVPRCGYLLLTNSRT
jgi:hypothetical protein